MNKIALLVIGLVITVSSLSVAAREGDTERMAACESGLQALYGADTSMKLKSLSHKRTGAHLRFKVKPTDGDSLRVTCLVDKEGGVSLMDSDGVALGTESYDARDQVSLIGQ